MEAYKSRLLGQRLLSCELLLIPAAGKKNLHSSHDHPKNINGMQGQYSRALLPLIVVWVTPKGKDDLKDYYPCLFYPLWFAPFFLDSVQIFFATAWKLSTTLKSTDPKKFRRILHQILFHHYVFTPNYTGTGNNNGSKKELQNIYTLFKIVN
jgi:hypothetical protein